MNPFVMQALAKPSDIGEDRKDAHLRICLEEAIERPGKGNGFEQWQFMHDALPELDRAEIDHLVASAFSMFFTHTRFTGSA